MRGSREAHFHPVAGRDAHPQRRLAGQLEVAGPHDHIHLHGLVGLVLQHHRQLEAVAEVQEARRGGAHHQRQAGGQVGFGHAELPPASSTATTITR